MMRSRSLLERLALESALSAQEGSRVPAPVVPPVR